MKEKKKNEALRWVFTISIVAFILSMTFSYISTTSITGLGVIPAILVLILVIFVGVIFDIVGVAVTCATEEEFHAMASKKVKGAKTAIKLIRSAPRVSNICNDVIGDICRNIKWCNKCNVNIKNYRKDGIKF